MQIVTYPHPTLRHVSKPIRRVDANMREMASHMFQLMYEAKGIGLAANQVDLPVRMFVVNVTGDPHEGDEFVFINPVVHSPKGSDEAEEGCLSLPELHGYVVRPSTVKLEAYDLTGNEITLELDGLMARVVQHELDHLDGVLFTDRLSTTGQIAAREALEDFELEFKQRRQLGAIPSDVEIAARLAELEQKYCGSPQSQAAATG